MEGYEVFQAADCQSTLKQLKLHNPQVVLCDVFLPDGNGVDMVTTIKKLYPELEVILLTAHGNIPDGVQAIKNGAFDYITKGDDNNKINYKLKCSAIVLNACTGKNDSAATIKITANVITPNVTVSVCNVPALSGINFFLARIPAMAT